MSDDSIRVEYNETLEPLEELLAGVVRPGDFFVSGTAEIPMPKVEVEGVGVLSFPVPESQVAALIARAARAPYGRGEKTILDESVRKVWQLTPEQVRIGGKSWPANFAGILERVAAGLGCEGLDVSAELYKLLVYDAGAFFLAHRDTEKAPGMFGTLVLALPSAHRGGELLIRHAGREVRVEMSVAEFSEVAFAAFYADCEHEVRPITEGTRVCLIYNLVQRKGAKPGGDTLAAPEHERPIAAAADLLAQSLTEPGAPVKIAWLLEHDYSPAGLAFSALKGADAARARVLVHAAERADCAVHLGIVHIEESGAAQEIYDQGRTRGRRRYDDEDDDEPEAGEEFEVIEVSDGDHYVDQWRDPHDRAIELGRVPLAPGELLPTGALVDAVPDEQRLMEASGNEGASFERSYLRAAVVIWRRERHAEVLLQCGVEAALPHLEECIAAGEKEASPAARKKAASVARSIVNAWSRRVADASYLSSSRPKKRAAMVELLVRLGDAQLLEEFITKVVTSDFDGSENAALAASADALGAPKTVALLSELIRRRMRCFPGECVALLETLTAAFQAAPKKEWRTALREIATALVDALDQIGKPAAPSPWGQSSDAEKPRTLNAASLARLLEVLGALDAATLREAAAQKLIARPAVFDPVGVIVPALDTLEKRGGAHEPDAALAKLWQHAAEFVLHRSESPPEPPRDWQQDAKLTCACADCRELQAFARDAVEPTHRFRIKKERRQHLHRIIEQHALDMTHVTDRVGSPQTLVCTKTRRSYERRLAEYRKDLSAMKTLLELSFAAGALAERLAAAIRDRESRR